MTIMHTFLCFAYVTFIVIVYCHQTTDYTDMLAKLLPTTIKNDDDDDIDDIYT